MLPVVGNGGNWNLWVLYDPRYNSELFPSETFGTPSSSSTPSADGGLTRKIETMKQQIQKQTGFGAPAASDNKPGGARRKRIRVVIGAAEGIEHLLPRQ